MSAAEVTIALSHPLAAGTETITEITLRRPKSKDLRGMVFGAGGLAWSDMEQLAARLAGLTVGQIGDLDIEDALRVQEAVGNFMPSFQGTSSP
ncbi:phage tail assembly protein [Oceanibacterium hippocampi]|uniref:Phage tail protein E n=1 Tax=Oceanibacterium hippocampi TaxID=745714 RepID=A0A1Y5TZY3_9PROT|nr:phage tail assembly protein [Oceanibacterium hippocampi]SLN77602.1 Phage tail protein E [Oceanibacterium hippocampi]